MFAREVTLATELAGDSNSALTLQETDDFCRQPKIARQLQRVGHKPKLSDEAVFSLALLQEFTGIVDEDDYWRYVCESFESCFPGQLVDRTQYHRRKKNLNPLVNTFRSQLVIIPGYHIIDCIGNSVLTVTKFFGGQILSLAPLNRMTRRMAKRCWPYRPRHL